MDRLVALATYLCSSEDLVASQHVVILTGMAVCSAATATVPRSRLPVFPPSLPIAVAYHLTNFKTLRKPRTLEMVARSSFIQLVGYPCLIMSIIAQYFAAALRSEKAIKINHVDQLKRRHRRYPEVMPCVSSVREKLTVISFYRFTSAEGASTFNHPVWRLMTPT